MPVLTPELLSRVVSTCQANVGEVAATMRRALDIEATVSVGQPGLLDNQKLSPELDGPGLVVLLTIGGSAALVLIPEATGLLPAWYSSPDPTGQSKLATLAQELGMLLLPEDCTPEESLPSPVKSIAEAIGRAGVAQGSPIVPLELRRADGKTSIASFVWPASQPGAIAGTSGAHTPQSSSASPVAPPDSGAKRNGPSTKRPPVCPADGKHPTVDDLPVYSRSLLRIRVPVVVTLAEKRQALARVVELGPGALLQFEKSCDEMLELKVGGQTIAIGEAVKIGDKFGLRITSMQPPGERFQPVGYPPSGKPSRLG